MEKLSKATGGKVVNNISILEKSDLGEAKLAEERKVGEDKWVFVEGCKSPRAMTILARGGSDRIVDEVERSFRDALMVVKDVVQDPKIVAGGGAPEIEVATKLRKFAQSLSGREQLAVNAFAEAMEAIPSILAENAGLDPIDVLVELRAIHEKGNKWFGVNVLEGKVDDMAKLNVYEPLVVKKQIIKSASEAATMILKIDDVIASSSAREARPPSGPSE
jgi:chaperonin GroEL (HSP60 family)